MTGGPRFGLVVGEPSGDVLGRGLMAALRDLFPDASFEGIGGPRMVASGFNTLFPMERLSVMGFREPLRRLPELLRIRAALARRFCEHPPAVLVGIDAPDFNLPLERRVRGAGVPTAHYVSPTVWAWRQGRVRQIAKSVDRMITLFPFEAAFFTRHEVPVSFVGHPLADEIPLRVETGLHRHRLDLPESDPVLAVLPGSRRSEVEKLADPMFRTAEWLSARLPELRVLVPSASAEIFAIMQDLLGRSRYRLKLHLLRGKARQAMAAADAVLLASGTATLEAALLKKPMVVAYQVNPVTFALLKRIVKVSHIAMPNLLRGRSLVPEFMQEDVRADVLGPALLELLDPRADHGALCDEFMAIHEELRCDASRGAAAAVAELLTCSRSVPEPC